MRHLRAIITIIMVFLLAPLAGDYFVAPQTSWGIGLVIIAYETWVLGFKKTAKDLADERKRLAEARRRVEQIKEEAAMVYLQPGSNKGAKSSSKLDVDNMSPVELANAARQIVQDIRGKKEEKAGGAATSLSKAA
jgi:hypothetical protein